MSDAAVAATPANFDAHLASVDRSPAPDMEPVQDSTGPSNDNSMQAPKVERSQAFTADRDVDDTPDPEQRVDEDGNPYEFEPGQDQDEPEPDEQPEEEQGGPSYEELRELHQVCAADELHEYFYDKLVRSKNGTLKPLREVLEGEMRMSDYSRKLQGLYAEQKQAQQVVQQNRQLIERMADPNILRASLKRLGPRHEQAFIAAAKQYAAEQLQLLKMPPAERARMEAEQRAAEYQQQLAEQRAEFERLQREAQQKPQHEAKRAQYDSLLQQHLPGLWAHYGVQDSPIAQREFMTNLQTLWDGREETVQEALERATIATAEALGDRVQEHRQHVQQRAPKQAPRQQQQALPPRRMPSAAPARPANSNGSGGGYRTTQFGDYLNSLGRR